MATITEKILKEHLADDTENQALNTGHGTQNTELPTPGTEISIKIDQTLTQDATGTMAYLEFEALGIPKVKTELSVSYVDHNMLQTDFMNADDHDYLKSVAAKYGVLYSRPGNGICHQVHLERFAAPGKTLLGSDSHTTTAGGVGSLAIGAGGLDIALAMGGDPFVLNMPKIVGVKITGELQQWVSAKDVILELLKRLTVKGGVGKIFEYFGPGVKNLGVPERATITNMGEELGATTSIFPSDKRTLDYLKMQGRENDWKELKADSVRDFDEVIELDLSTIEPNVAKPHSPDNVCKVSELGDKKVNQVIVGSCTNSSYWDLMIVALALKGKKVHPDISFCVLPGSKQVYETIARNGALADLIAAGARILESACGPCIGMGTAPRSAGVTVRTFNRNFKGRCGTADAEAYLVSPETAAAIAINGVFTDPRKLGEYPKIPKPKPVIDDSMVIRPPADGSKIEIIRGPNIKPLPELKAVEDKIEKEVLLKVGDNITTDQIMPAGAKVLPLRSNISAISEHVYVAVDKEFPKRAKEKGGGIIIGGENYGQGSSREHAAIAPLYLGVKVVIAKNFARIHKANLVNWGIVPLEFENTADYDKVAQGDVLVIEGLCTGIKNGKIRVVNKTKNISFNALCAMGDKTKEVLLAGGNIMYIKNR